MTTISSCIGSNELIKDIFKIKKDVKKEDK